MLTLVLLATALIANASPAPSRGTIAVATARATIMTPATLRLGPGNQFALTTPDATAPHLRPRNTLRPCDASDPARLCAVVVFDLP